jgi:hypothetical protein
MENFSVHILINLVACQKIPNFIKLINSFILKASFKSFSISHWTARLFLELQTLHLALQFNNGTLKTESNLCKILFV